jgi:hypothetical protein
MTSKLSSLLPRGLKIAQEVKNEKDNQYQSEAAAAVCGTTISITAAAKQNGQNDEYDE